MPTVHVSLAHRSYDIVIDHGLLAETSTRCRQWCGLDTPGSALIVTDAHLADPVVWAGHPRIGTDRDRCPSRRSSGVGWTPPDRH